MRSRRSVGEGSQNEKHGEFLFGFDMPQILPEKIDSRPSLPVTKTTTRKSVRRSLVKKQISNQGVQLHKVEEGERATEAEDFKSGEEPRENILSVSELNQRISRLLEGELDPLWVEGEISNFRRQPSGHCYFTLKDEGSQLSCVLFARSSSMQGGLQLRDGLQVCLLGQIGVYHPRGQYQLMVRLVRPKGEGLLQLRFEELKRRLTAEGLFDQERKRTLPRFPRRIGVVTSPTGAAIRDFLQVLHRRHPGLRVVISPVRVQGKGAASDIAAAITELSQGSQVIGNVDVIVVTRGGGSLEDLWEFNEEKVARAIAASLVPVVSAVGHEIDFTIADFVADLRASTPSAAGELLAADGAGVMERASSLVMRIGRETVALLEGYDAKHRYIYGSTLFREPLRRLDEARQTLDRREEDLSGMVSLRMERLQGALSTSSSLLAVFHPGHMLAKAKQGMLSLAVQMEAIVGCRLVSDKGRLERVAAALSALSPEATLSRGFSITRTSDGKVITSDSQVALGAVIHTQLAEGEIESVRKD